MDTPGHYDFYPEVKRVINLIDVAVLIISIDQGLTAHSNRLIDILQEKGIPIIFFIN